MEIVPIATVSAPCHTAEEFDSVCASLQEKLGGSPDLLIASYSSLCDEAVLTDRIHATFPNAAIMGASTCRGAITGDGLVAFGEPNLSLFGLTDSDGAYGVGFATYEDSVAKAAAAALEAAIRSADRAGELPDFVWVHSSPGVEEQVVATLDELLGEDVSIVGGSAADERLEAKWSCFAGTQFTGEGLALAVFYSSYEISSSFQCGYLPTQKTGVATRCDGRTVYEIDGQPAAVVYNEWAGCPIDLACATLPVNVLSSSTLTPLGIAVGELSGIAYFNLAHPETYTSELGLTFFCEIEQGQTLTLMNGTEDNIISRPGRVAQEAISHIDASPSDIIGSLVVFCGGCLLAVESRADEIPKILNSTLHDQPYLCCFTFGEQGRFLSGENRHGNLMISVTVFRK